MSEYKKQIKKIVKLIGRIISVLAILFIVKAVYTLGFDFDSVTNWPLFIGVIILCSIAKCVTVYMSGSAWYGWLRFFSGKKNQGREAVCVYAKANIGKYLPGNVMHYVERNLFADKLGISQKKLALSTLVEVISLIFVAMLMAILVSTKQLANALYNIFGENYLTIVLFGILVIILSIIIVSILFKKKIKSILAEYEKKEFLKTLVINMFLYAFVLTILGAIMVALYCYMGGKFTFSSATLIISGYVIAWVLGFVVPGAPGGIGVRELVITVLLSSVVGEGLIVTLSVTHRLITIIGDFMAYVVMLFIKATNNK